MAKQQQAANSSPATSYSDLFSKIDELKGKEKAAFCKTLTGEEKRSYIQYLREKDVEMVTGVFKCFEPVGGTVSFTVRPYEGVEHQYTMRDGESHTIPRCIAKRLNNEWQGIGTWHPTHSHVLDSNGNPTVQVGRKNFRFAFITGDY